MLDPPTPSRLSRPHRRWLIGVVLCLLIVVAPSASAEAPIEAAEAAFNAGDLATARGAFEALAGDADAATRGRAALGLAMVARQRFDAEQAQGHLAAAAAAFAEGDARDWAGIVHLQRAEVARDLGEDLETQAGYLDAARKAFDRALEQGDDRDDDVALMRWRALTQQRIGDLELARDPARATAAYRESLALFNKAQAGREAADVAFLLGRGLWVSRDYESAQEVMRQALGLYRKVDDKLAVGRCHAAVAQLWLLRSDNEKALQSFKLAMTAFDSFASAASDDVEARRDELRRDELAAHHGWALALENKNDFEAAAEHLDRAREHATALGAEAWLQRIDLSRARLDASAGKVDEAIATLTEVCPTLEEEPGGPKTRCELLYGELLVQKGDAAAARPLLEKVLERNKTLADPAVERAAMLALARALLALDEVESASGILEGALAVVSDDDKITRATLLEGLARVAVAKGESSAAHDHYEAAARIFRALRDRSNEARLLLADGKLYILEDNWDDAKDPVRDAARAYARLEDAPHAAEAHFLLAGVYLGRGRERDALGYARDALKYYEGLEDRQGQARSLVLAARILVADREPEDARESAQKALALLGENATGPAALEVNLILGTLAADDPKAALPFLERASTLVSDEVSDVTSAQLWSALATAQLEDAQNKEAAENFAKAFDRYATLNNPRGKADSRFGLARALEALGEKEKAIAAYGEAGELYRDVSNGRRWRKQAERAAEKLQDSK